jgi:hypothetical protein
MEELKKTKHNLKLKTISIFKNKEEMQELKTLLLKVVPVRYASITEDPVNDFNVGLLRDEIDLEYETVKGELNRTFPSND